MAHAAYLNTFLKNPKLVLDQTAKKLNTLEFDGIAVSGVSGMLIGPTLAYLLNKRLAIVRKADDTHNHSKHRIESNFEPGDRWVIVDDLRSTGATVRRITSQLKNAGEADPDLCVAQYFYNRDNLLTGARMNDAEMY